jgi:RimJ/RimL family protein N-acetyltransferase
VIVPSLVAPVVEPGVLSRMAQPELLVGDHLILRPWEAADGPSVVEAYAEPDIQTWNLRTVDEAEAVLWIESWAAAWNAETDACWAIARRSDRSVVGRIALRHLLLPAGSAEVTYWVLPHGRRNGAASLATKSLSHWAFESLGLHRLDLLHSAHNQPSCGVATRAGFDLEGTLKSYLLHTDGWHDMHIHALVNGAAPECDEVPPTAG